MKQKFLKMLDTDSANWGSLIMRVPLGLALMAHGWGKLFKEGNPEGFAKWLSSLGAEPSYFLAVLTGLSETVGGGLLVIGLLSRLSALSNAIVMVTAIVLAHIKQPMFGQGSYELQIMMLAAAVMLLIQGGGKLSLDAMISKYLTK